ncbi:MAG: hypothetical protein IJJ83_07885, partial [Muribaculaceae bacterium]|nr:hypothetical protein [Muribaculaceae bacterium]
CSAHSSEQNFCIPLFVVKTLPQCAHFLVFDILAIFIGSTCSLLYLYAWSSQVNTRLPMSPFATMSLFSKRVKNLSSIVIRQQPLSTTFTMWQKYSPVNSLR